MPTPPVLHLPSLHFAHAGDPPLFSGLPLTLGQGLHWLQGDSGSGKTTLLRLLAGDLPGLAGASLNGVALDVGSTAWRAAVCHVDVRGEGFDGLTAADLMQQLRQQHPALDAAAWLRHIEGFGLAPHAAKTMFMLSTGMRRKAGLAALLASGAALLLLDEPLAGLDAPSIAWLQQALSSLAGQPGRAALIACGSWPQGLPRASTVALDRH
ncbi:MAG: ATP-binding cassette domain-containing protein [Pseudomonadota bacterium]